MKKPRKPRIARSPSEKWTVRRALADDIDKVFDHPAKIASAIGVSVPTWNKIFDREGVKHKTAVNAVKDFFDVVCRVQEGARAPEGASERIAIDMYNKYKDLIVDHNYKQFVEMIPAGGESMPGG